MKSIVEFPAANDFNSDSVSSDNCFDATLRAVAPTQAATESFYMVEGSDDTDDSDIRTGLQSDGKERVSLIRFSQLPELSPRDTVTKAVMKLYPGSATRVEEVYVGAYAPQHDWTAAEMTWSIMSCLMSDAELHSVIMSGVNSPVLFDITNLVRRWYKDPSSNRGILLRRPDLENDSSRYPASFYPQDDDTRYPRLEITYVSHTGTESRWTYQSLNAGRAGAVSADLFNGSLVAAHADTAFGGLRGGVSVAHTYNSCECSGNNFFCGYGWRTSLHQTVHTETMGTNTYYVWTDGDGTEHYFKVSGSQPYADEDGQHLKLRVQEAAGTVTITDLKDSVMTFTKETGWEKYWLTQTKDVLDNAVNITYLSEGKINRGTDPVGRYVQFVYSNDLLSSLVPHMADDSTGAYVSCAYTYTNGNLTGVSYSDLPNEQTGYTYTGHLLTGMANYDGLAVSVAYESNENSDPETRRVTSLKQTGGTGASSLDGAKMLFTYKEMSTHVTFLAGDTANDETDHELIYQFNDNGNVVSVRDDAGYAAYKGYDAEYPNYPDVASRLQRTSVNLLTNHSFETSTGTTYWTTALSNGATGSFTYATNIKKMGGKSLKTSHTNASGEMTVSQAVTVKTGETYTFSGYVRTENDGVQVKPVILRGGVVAAEGAGVSSAGVWTRVHVTAEINPDGQTSDTITVQFRITGAAGAAYIDCAQLEYGDVPNRYNMLTNGCFEYADANDQPTGWTAKDGNTANDAVIELTPPEPGQEDPHRLHPDYIGRHVLRVNGYPNKKKGYYQAVVVGGSEGDAYTVGGWAKARSKPIDETLRAFCLRVAFRKSSNNSWVTADEIHWNREWTDWQYISGGVKAPADYNQIRVWIEYENNIHEAYFDGIALYKEAFGEEYSYNSSGRPLHVTSLAGHRDTRLYDENGNMSTYRAPGVSDYDWSYHYGFDNEPNKKHLLRYRDLPMGEQDIYAYDAYGNETARKRQNTSLAAIRTTKAYTSDGDKLASQNDSRGNTTSYTYSANDTLQSVTTPNSQSISYTYDTSRRITSVSATNAQGTYKNAYTYENDRVKTVSHNTTTGTPDVSYTFNYDSLGRQTEVKVGNQTLSENVYDNDRFGKLRRTRFGNNQGIEKNYDRYGRDIGTKVITFDGQGNVNGGDSNWRYEYSYGPNGRIVKLRDNNLQRDVWNEFDEANRPIRLTETTTDGTLLRQTRLSYSATEHPEDYTEKLYNTPGAGQYNTNYTYDYDDRLTKAIFDTDNYRVTYTYDKLGRLTKYRPRNGGTSRDTDYTYLNSSVPIPGLSLQASTSLVSGISQTGVSFSYGYDTSTANIVSETRTGGAYAGTVTYEYDTLGQLIRVNDPKDTTANANGTTYTYEYDLGGNILNVRAYVYTEDSITAGDTPVTTISYTYANANWKDQLTAYNGKPITYDEIGNPTMFGQPNEAETWTYTWEAGRQLKSMTKQGMTVSFDYDRNGLRTRKTVTDTNTNTTQITNYTLNGSQITHMTRGNDWMHFYYGANDRPVLVNFNGAVYTYVYSLQGDVVALLNSAGQIVVEYKYDAWGKVLGTTAATGCEALTEMNPFRYRGCIFDKENDAYYLRYRYYSIEYDRFISADDIIADLSHRMVSLSAYVYCNNNPIVFDDKNGHVPEWIKNTVKSWTENLKPFVVDIQQALNDVDLTYSTGYNLGISLGFWNFSGQAGLAIDTKGNIAVQGYRGGGLTTGTPSFSVAEYKSISNAPDVSKLNNLGASVGASASLTYYLSGDFNIMPDDENNTQYYGVTVGAGIGAPGTEFHVEWGETETFVKINIFDIMRDIYHGIMAWCLIIIILSGMSFNCAAMASSHSSDEPYKQETLKQEFIRLSRIRRIWNLPSQCAMTMDVNDDNEIALHLRSLEKDYIVVIDKEGSLLFGYEFDVFKSLFGLLWEGSNLFVFTESGGTVITINNKGTIIEVNKVSSIDDKQLISSLNKSVGRLSKEVKDNRYELINKFGLLNPLVNYDYSTLVVHTSDGGYRCIFDVDLHKKLSIIMFILFYRYGIVLALYNIIRHYYTIPHKNNIIESSHVI